LGPIIKDNSTLIQICDGIIDPCSLEPFNKTQSIFVKNTSSKLNINVKIGIPILKIEKKIDKFNIFKESNILLDKINDNIDNVAYDENFKIKNEEKKNSDLNSFSINSDENLKKQDFNDSNDIITFKNKTNLKNENFLDRYMMNKNFPNQENLKLSQEFIKMSQETLKNSNDISNQQYSTIKEYKIFDNSSQEIKKKTSLFEKYTFKKKLQKSSSQSSQDNLSISSSDSENSQIEKNQIEKKTLFELSKKRKYNEKYYENEIIEIIDNDKNNIFDNYIKKRKTF
jgi:hypothetical protein